jgi:hypothetical protein
LFSTASFAVRKRIAVLKPRSRRRDAGNVREHPVEHEQIGVELAHGRDRAAAGRLLAHVEPLVAERRRDRVDDRRLVVHDEHLASACPSSIPSAFQRCLGIS